jgi:hypothetical protein
MQENSVSRPLKAHEIVSTFELEPILLGDDACSALKFRIEVLRNSEINVFFPKVYRWETFRIQPTFPQDDGKMVCDLSDEEILVKDFSIDCNQIIGNSIEEVVEKTISEIKKVFMIT